MLYVPSMRNGAELLEDRGNAIISTEPLLDPLALELPLERQRRVAISTAIQVTINERPTRLELFNAHLEPLSSPKSLWVFRNPRGPQARAILDLLKTPRFDNGEASVGTVLGGDFNIVQRGIDEERLPGAPRVVDEPGVREPAQHACDGPDRSLVLQAGRGLEREDGTSRESFRIRSPPGARQVLAEVRVPHSLKL